MTALTMAGCGGDPGFKVSRGSDWRAYVKGRSGAATADLDAIQFRPGLCEGDESRPDYARLDELHLVRFLERQRIDVQIERPRADLVYLVLGGANTSRPVRLRVAVLGNADEAGRELHQAILQHGPGSWGVHRSNLAVLGPVASPTDAIAFAAMTKLACWGVFTIADTDDAFVIPGAYAEL
jgi:hypothetical protein